MPRASSPSRGGAWVAAAFPAAGLALRAGISDLPHREGDERIYAALEIAHGFQGARGYPDRAWIRPLFGEPR